MAPLRPGEDRYIKMAFSRSAAVVYKGNDILEWLHA